MGFAVTHTISIETDRLDLGHPIIDPREGQR